MLNVQRYALGPFQANGYLVWERSGGAALLVDACAEADRLLSEIATRDLTLEAILQTHAHADHIAALPEVVAATSAPVYLHPDARPMLLSADENLSALAGFPVTAPVETIGVEDGEVLTLLDREVEVLFTPGHAPGSVCYHFPSEGFVFSGDALFAHSIGRTDFPGGSYEVLTAGIREKLLTLDDETRVFPGHMGETTIGEERLHNPFL